MSPDSRMSRFVIVLHVGLVAEDRDDAEGTAKVIERFITKRGGEVITNEVNEEGLDRELR